MSTKEKTSYTSKAEEKLLGQKSLILYNDDHNTFDFVIETLIDVCEHDPMQAENCAMIAHFKGRCPIKSGTDKELLPYYTEMTNRKLTVEIK
ncbi:MAG: ATP-dependent Clp protease adaptor ClpS [Bacteroidales bacterium]|jgi:ATP-dependent Clp protease adaptor protein ClpS|nr:ATP-dependent Clp protease adaptor ClpS [Bacteroidales bacterium]